MHTVKACTMGLASLLIASFGTSAPAQQRDGGDLTSIQLEEIVVTARRREESAQNVPVTLTAITADNLTNRSAVLLSDIAKETPSLTIQARVSDRNTQIVSLRGQVQTDAATTLDPSVGVYLNDVYVARNNGANFELFDVDRIEVLSGPQGTLYGRNTTGGAIKLVTAAADPTAGMSGYALVNGGNFDARRAEAAINIPLSDKLAVRFAGLNLQRDGYGKLRVGSFQPSPASDGSGGVVFDASAPFTARKTFDTDDKDIKAGRLSLTFEPTDKLGFSLVGDYSKQASNGATGYDVGSSFIAAPAIGSSLNNAIKPYGNYRKCSSDFYTACQDSAPTSRAEIYGVGLTTTYDTGVGTAKLIYGYRDVESAFTSDLEGSPIPFETIMQPSKVHQNSVEAQFQGERASFDYTAGLYYFKEIGTEGFNDTTSVVDPAVFSRILEGNADNESKSVYGQIGYAITKTVRLTVGGRYTRDDKSLVSTAALLPNASQPLGLCLFSGSGTLTAAMLSPSPTPANCRFASDNSFDHFSWTAGLDWQIRDNVLVYAKSSEGYRSGGQNLRGIDASTQQPFKEETIRDFEVGLKSRPFERLQLNLTYYHSNYDDIQTTLFKFFPAPQNTTTFVVNQGTADIDGVELQSTIIATKNISFDLTGSYNNFNFKLNTFVPPLTPKYKGSAAVNLLFPVSFGDWSGRVSYSYQDKFFVTNQRIEAATIPQATIGSRGLVDARLALSLRQYDTTIALFGTNLTNKEYFESGTLFSVANPLGSGIIDVFNRLQIGAPRLYGLEVSKRF